MQYWDLKSSIFLSKKKTKKLKGYDGMLL